MGKYSFLGLLYHIFEGAATPEASPPPWPYLFPIILF
jgi:hypothetical protein